MSEAVLQDGDVVVRAYGALRRITLNRPQALNAITLDMVVTMTALLAPGRTILPSAPSCSTAPAGGLLPPAAISARSTMRRSRATALPEKFWATEYLWMS